MKIHKMLGLIAGAMLLAGTVRAADEVKTITGEAVCAKCELNQQDKCQTVIQAKEGDKVVSYYLAGNDTAKAFHPKVCKSSAEVTATGVVSTVDGKQVLTASAIELKK
jgi:type 1 fimbria pilin